MSSDRMQGTYDPRYADIYQRGGDGDAASRMASPAPLAPALPQVIGRTADPSEIREVGPGTVARPAHDTPRNPFDVWVWLVAGVLLAAGTYLLVAPILHDQQYLESMALAPSGPTGPPWFQYTVTAAPPLILLGGGTAVVQLFVLSIRHTLRTR
ncbi:hypothetical protein ACX80L_06410 [Arthrobacter sp. MDT1-48-3]